MLLVMVVCLLTTSGANHAEVPTAIQHFVVLGQEGVWIKQGGTIVSGDIGANTSSAGPFLSDGAEVVVGLDVQVLDPAAKVMGDSLRIRQGAQVYNAYYNDLSGLGQILGTRVSPVTLPLVQGFPSVPNLTPGTQNLIVPLNGTLRLSAGSYGALLARSGSTVTFAGGTYDFQAWDIRSAVKLYFEAPTEIRIAGRLDTDLNTYVGPSPTAAGISAAKISIIVTGINGSTGTVDATPKAAEFGLQNTVAATVSAPNGTLWIKQGSTATGAFLGRWVVIGEQVRLTHASAADHDPPTVTASVAPPPNAAGWHHEDVTVSFTCSDAGSGIAQCPDPVVVHTEGAGQVVTGTAVDQVGHSATVTVSLNIDTTPPGVAITSPPDGTVRNTAPIIVAGTITDALSGAAGVACGDTAAGLTGSTFTCQMALTEGANPLIAHAIDRAGNTSASMITVSLDTTPPAVIIVSPADGSRVDADVLKVSGTVDEPSATVMVNGLPALVSADGTWAVDGVPLDEGDNRLTVVVMDAAGNRWEGAITVSRETAMTLTLCAAPYQDDAPHPPIETCADQAVASYLGFGSTIGLVVGAVAPQAVSLTINGVELPDGEEITDAGELWDGMREGTFFWAYLHIPQIPGRHPVTAIATDAAGRQQSATVSVSPALIFCAELFREQTPQPPVDECATQAFAGYIGFVAGLLDASEVSVAINHVVLPDGIEIFDNGPIFDGLREGDFFWAFVNIPQVDGLHPFTAVATNTDGAERQTTVSFLRDTTPPRLTLTAPLTGAFLNTSTPTIMGTVDDPDATVRLGYFGQAIPVVNGYFQTTANLPFEGSSRITVSATDPSGNLSVVTISIIRDTVPPTVAITAPQTGGAVNSPTVAVQGTVTDLSPVTAAVTVNAGPTQPLALSAGAYGGPATLSEGVNQLVVTATDAAGNTGTATANILLDTAPPAITITAPTEGEQLSGVVSITADVSDPLAGIAQVELLANGANVASRSAPPYGFALNTATLPAGSATLTVRATDRAGNSAEASVGVTILGGQIALQITSPANGDVITQSPILVRGTLKKNDSEPITEEVGITVNGMLAQFQGTEFGVEGIFLEPGVQTITAIATGNEGILATTSIEATLTPGEPDTPPLSLRVAPSCPVLPSSQATFTTDEALPYPIVFYQLDADGDGTPDIEGPVFGEVRYTYPTPELYFPALTATDSTGNQWTATTMVNVLDPSVVDSLLRGKWATMTGALSNGDATTALGQIAAETRTRYETMFNLLQDQLPSIMSTAREFNFLTLACNTAKYELVTAETDGTYSYEVIFSKDTNGLWKIREF